MAKEMSHLQERLALEYERLHADHIALGRGAARSKETPLVDDLLHQLEIHVDESDHPPAPSSPTSEPPPLDGYLGILPTAKSSPLAQERRQQQQQRQLPQKEEQQSVPNEQRQQKQQQKKKKQQEDQQQGGSSDMKRLSWSKSTLANESRQAEQAALESVATEGSGSAIATALSLKANHHEESTNGQSQSGRRNSFGSNTNSADRLPLVDGSVRNQALASDPSPRDDQKSVGESSLGDYYSNYGRNSILSIPGLTSGSRRRHHIPKNFPRHLVHPAFYWYRLWSKTISLLILFTVFFTPMQVAFMDKKAAETIIPVLTVDCFFFVDILIQFNLAVDEKAGCITSRTEIARLYATSGRLVTDIISTIPFGIMWNTIDGLEGMNSYQQELTSMILSLLPLMRIYRILIMLRAMQKDSRFNLLVVVVGKVVLFILICTHTAGCIFYAIARLEDFDEDTWVGVSFPELPDDSLASRYIHVLFWAVATFKAGPASGDLYPISEREMLLACASMVVNICLQTYLVSSMSALLTTADLTIYAFRKRLRQVMEFASQRGLPRQLRESVKEYLAFKFSANDELEHDVMSALPELYRQRISHALYKDVIGGMPMLQSCSSAFMWQLHGILHATMHASYHSLIGAGEPATKLYILAKGEVGLYYNDELCETRHPGECMGEIPFVCRKVQPFAVHTHVACRVLSISREDWEGLVASHPEANFQIKSSLEQECDARLSKLEEGTVQKVYSELLQCIRANMIESKEATTGALCFASARGDLAEMRQLLMGHPADCADYDLRTPLHIAAADGMVDAISLLVDNLANVNAVDKFGRTPLLEACRSRQLHAGRLLYQHGARLGFSSAMMLESQLPSLMEGGTQSQSTAFMNDGTNSTGTLRRSSRRMDHVESKSAAIAKHLEGGELCQAASDVEQLWYLHALLQYGADCNAGDYDSRTALHVACASGNKPAVELLLEQDGIDLDPRDNFGRTPLMEAVRHENEPCARLLTARGAFHGFVEDLSLATANSVIAGQELCQAAFSNQLTYLFSLVVHCGVNVDAADYDFRTALMLACAEGNTDVAITLMQHKADIHRQDRWGHTAITEARDHGHGDLASLLEQMADLAVEVHISTRSNEGRPPEEAKLMML